VKPNGRRYPKNLLFCHPVSVIPEHGLPKPRLGISKTWNRREGKNEEEGRGDENVNK
jgi:hypothetical protein